MKTWGRRWRCWRWSVKHHSPSYPPSNPLVWQWKMWIWRGINSGGQREREKKRLKWDLGGRKENGHMHIDLITITWRRGAHRACVTCVCVYPCVYVYICVCTCVCMCMCVCVCMCVCIRVYMCISVCTCVCMCTYVCACVHVCTYVCTRACVYVCMCVHHACVCEVGREVGRWREEIAWAVPPWQETSSSSSRMGSWWRIPKSKYCHQ